MNTTITLQITPQGVLIPRENLGDLDIRELEAFRENEAIIIRPKSVHSGVHGQIRQMLRESGVLYEPDWGIPPPVSPEDREQLAKKAASSQPLSEIIITDRQDRV